jgi:hypothetical protein
MVGLLAIATAVLLVKRKGGHLVPNRQSDESQLSHEAIAVMSAADENQRPSIDAND